MNNESWLYIAAWLVYILSIYRYVYIFSLYETLFGPIVY